MTGWLDRVRGLLGSGAAGTDARTGRGGRVTGDPPSGNGASSFHLFWDLPGEFAAVSATLEVSLPPTARRLYFWALQASFVEAGRQGGAGHLGLQWHPQYPGSTAVNWGGYRAGGGELDGSRSLLAGTLGNVNTRDYPWVAGRRYRLSIAPAPPELQPGGGLTAWRGSVTDLATGSVAAVRDLLAAGSRLTSPMVWSEVFARCDHPTVEVRWSDLEALTSGGEIVRPASVGINYQNHADGGCANTSTAVVDGVAIQRTNVARDHAQGVHLPLP